MKTMSLETDTDKRLAELRESYDRLAGAVEARFLGHREVVEVLLAHGADLEIRDPKWATPLFLAALSGHLDVVRDLLAAGADAGCRLVSGTPVASAAETVGHREIATLLRQHGAK